MASRKRARRVAWFLSLAFATVVLAIVAATLHKPASCHGLSCPSGGGAASSATSTSPLASAAEVATVVCATGTLLQGLAALRKPQPTAAGQGAARSASGRKG
jgi:hypothetical protein